jgi:hypothetical protein
LKEKKEKFPRKFSVQQVKRVKKEPNPCVLLEGERSGEHTPHSFLDCVIRPA